MGKKGEDVKHLFAHLGLDPGTYRDLKSGENDGAKADAKSRSASSADKPAKKKPAKPASKPRVAASARSEPTPPPEQPEVADMDVEHEADTVAAQPDRWSLLAMLGDGAMPVADLPDPELAEEMVFGEASGASGGESDTPRLRRAGSLSALWRGSRESEDDVPVARADDGGADDAEPLDDDAPPATAPDFAATDESGQTAGEIDEVGEHLEPMSMESEEEPEQPKPVRRQSTGAIGKLMNRLRETPAERHTEQARLKLNYERREKTVVAEKPVDQDIAAVFGRLKRSRVD